MRRYVIAFALVALVSAPLSAELKYTSRMSAKVVAGATAGNDMMAAMVGPMMLQMFGGEEGVEMTVTVNEDGRMRTDYAAGFVGMPAGAVGCSVLGWLLLVQPTSTSSAPTVCIMSGSRKKPPISWCRNRCSGRFAYLGADTLLPPTHSYAGACGWIIRGWHGMG